MLPPRSLPSMDDFLVEGLSEVEPAYGTFEAEGRMYAGQLPMVWLNGGPGCSSFNCGVMFENSPVTVPLRPAGYARTSAREPFEYNENAWTKATAMLYVEQPVGVGFSTGGPDPEKEADLAGDFYIFLQNFFQVFDTYQSSKLFIVGESYAGYFAPSIAYKIFKEQKKLDDTSDIAINLAGVGLGNGWANAMVQGPATIDYGYWHGLYDEHTRQALHAEWNHCINSPKDEEEPTPFHKVNPPDDCGMMLAPLMAGGKGVWDDNLNGPNAYDVTTWDGYPVILGGNSSIENFFNDPRVKEKLHAPEDVFWRGCIPGAGRRLQEARRFLGLLENDQPMSTVPYLAEMLDGGVRVLIYNGDRDLSTNAQGSEMLLNGMEWSGAEEWFTTPRGLWVNPKNSKDKTPAGYAKSLKGLDFVVIYNSGHLVPYNQPENALDLITRFIKNESYYDRPLPSFDFYHKTRNPGTTLANGMYPLMPPDNSQSKNNHHGLNVALTAISSFVAGAAVTSFFMGPRGGYQKL
ncbi:Pheromone-processing carboxypeptidase KEX1 [Seminavis robusta]|uniref:Carboxypeptidase n=1 Tax=Seminavis robusta TaxID=568900 RepID=A0A9N8D9V1_9STRA|nr:Pheromone-processing carboxypeptidase KEX1 [Seminavis robusta]|eukprot:Sro56_g033040.1 Pheromone-processing carboxypeptidase KEX1 (518) ;mRNA; f:133575-135488